MHALGHIYFYVVDLLIPLFDRLKYIEQELAKKRGKSIDVNDQVENDLKHAEDELYKIPEHLKVTGIFLCTHLSTISKRVHL